MAPTLTVPNRALRRVAWVDPRNPNRKIASLFNPTELPLALTVEVGELYPIGWSQAVQQYAHTKSMTYTVSLPFSMRAYLDRNIPFTHMKQAAAFFRSFGYANRPGEAPSHLMMVWPNTATILNTVRSVDVNFVRWDVELEVAAYVVVLNLVEVRRNFYDRRMAESPTGDLFIPDSALVGTGSSASSGVEETVGRPLRVSGTTSKFRGGGIGGVG